MADDDEEMTSLKTSVRPHVEVIPSSVGQESIYEMLGCKRRTTTDSAAGGGKKMKKDRSGQVVFLDLEVIHSRGRRPEILQLGLWSFNDETKKQKSFFRPATPSAVEAIRGQNTLDRLRLTKSGKSFSFRHETHPKHCR